MKLEREAKAYMYTKTNLFKADLITQATGLEVHYNRNLHNCDEKENALERLTESQMWAKLAAEKYGIK